jgi:hypothetical protein
LVSPLFSLTAERTALGGDAAAENRAALLTLTFYANQRPLGMLVPAAYQWPRPWPAVVELKQRQDSALHFLISAVIAAEAGMPLADAVGLWKALADRGRSDPAAAARRRRGERRRSAAAGQRPAGTSAGSGVRGTLGRRWRRGLPAFARVHRMAHRGVASVSVTDQNLV